MDLRTLALIPYDSRVTGLGVNRNRPLGSPSAIQGASGRFWARTILCPTRDQPEPFATETNP